MWLWNFVILSLERQWQQPTCFPHGYVERGGKRLYCCLHTHTHTHSLTFFLSLYTHTYTCLFHGWGSLAQYSLWGSKRVGHNWVTTQQHIHSKTSYLKEAVFPLRNNLLSVLLRERMPRELWILKGKSNSAINLGRGNHIILLNSSHKIME